MSGRGESGIAGRSWASWLLKVVFGLIALAGLLVLAIWLTGEVVSVIVAVIANLFVMLAAALVLFQFRVTGRAQRLNV